MSQQHATIVSPDVLVLCEYACEKAALLAGCQVNGDKARKSHQGRPYPKWVFSRFRRASHVWHFQWTPVILRRKSGNSWPTRSHRQTARPPARSSVVRRIFNGTFYVLRTGLAWAPRRYLPREYGARETARI